MYWIGKPGTFRVFGLSSFLLTNLQKQHVYYGGFHMTVNDVIKLLDATPLTCEDKLDREVLSACGSDMMSYVLAFAKTKCVLLTGLCNPQVIRTAEMMDIVCIVFVRDKRPDEDMIELAKERGIAILATGHRMFGACGILYTAGLRGGTDSERYDHA